MKFDLVAHMYRQRTFSEQAFGPGYRLDGVMEHIREELEEIEKAPDDLEEWIDVLLLVLDGAWRNTGASPEAVAEMIEYKQTKNENREWPDWRDVPADRAIKHIKT